VNLRGSIKPVDLMEESDLNVVTLERLERRLNEECGTLRLDIANLRTEMVDRSSELLKWLLAFFVAQTAALGGLMAVLR
jgi:hypothetical protein